MELQLSISLVSVQLLYSTILLVTMLIPPPPPPLLSCRHPHSVTAKRTGYDCVSWTAPSTGTPLAGYEVFYNNVSGGNTSSTKLTLTGLTLASYSIFVLGYGAEGEPVLPRPVPTAK